MKSPLRTRGVLVAAATGLALTLSACGSDDSPEGSAPSSSATTSAPAAETTAAPVASDQPFGAGCSVVPAEGEGSFAGMADDPVTTAAANSPALSQLVTAVTAANLGESLNSLQNITVLAPANTAFDAVGPEAFTGMLADIPRLTAVLTHHVIQGRLTPAQLVGTHTTLNNDQLTIEGSGESLTIAGEGALTGTDASVICGNVQTATATVYIIDQVLAPPAA